MPLKLKSCVHCGKRFKSFVLLTCSDACSLAWCKPAPPKPKSKAKPTPREKRQPAAKLRNPKVCTQCSKTFTPSNGNTKVCSRWCFKRRKKSKNDQRSMGRERTCEICSKTFLSLNTSKTCSTPCRKERVRAKFRTPAYRAWDRARYRREWATNDKYRERHRNYTREYTRYHRLGPMGRRSVKRDAKPYVNGAYDAPKAITQTIGS
jgi:hypothetical protein